MLDNHDNPALARLSYNNSFWHTFRVFKLIWVARCEAIWFHGDHCLFWTTGNNRQFDHIFAWVPRCTVWSSWGVWSWLAFWW